MPYTDFQTQWTPLPAKEASLRMRAAFVLLFLILLPMLLWGQSAPLTTTSIAGLLDSQVAVLHSGHSSQPSSGDKEADATARDARPVVPALPQPVFARAFAPARVFAALELVPALPAPDAQHMRRSSNAAAELQVFTGARFRDMVQLRWEAATSTNTIGFQIERRSQRHSTWQMAGYVRCQANGAVKQEYTFLDQLDDNGVSYYRLRQIRSDAEGVVSPVITVTPDAILPSFTLWKHSLQPFQNYGTVSVGLAEASEITLTLHDSFGKTIATLLDYDKMQPGHYVLPFGTASLRPGLNVLRLQTSSGTRHLLVEHF